MTGKPTLRLRLDVTRANERTGVGPTTRHLDQSQWTRNEPSPLAAAASQAPDSDGNNSRKSQSDLHVLLLEDRRNRRPRGEPHHVRVGEGLALLGGAAGALREGRVQRSARLNLLPNKTWITKGLRGGVGGGGREVPKYVCCSIQI